MNTVIWSVEGNIGSGKSTLIQLLKERNTDRNVIFIPEPVNEWEKIKNENNENIIEVYYKDPKKLLKASENLKSAMKGLEISEIPEEKLLQNRGW